MAVETCEPQGGRRAAVIVAHPDDETLWAGGVILARPHWSWFIATLCRAGDADRTRRFHRACEGLNARGAMADADDGPDQTPLPDERVQGIVEGLLGTAEVDLLLTHGPRGEYTRHRRHEQTCRAVVALWSRGSIRTKALWMFAFQDGGGAHLPHADPDAPIQEVLGDAVWSEKYRLMTEVYGFRPDSWEARTTPRQEAFWSFENAQEAADWVARPPRGMDHESAGSL